MSQPSGDSVLDGFIAFSAGIGGMLLDLNFKGIKLLSIDPSKIDITTIIMALICGGAGVLGKIIVESTYKFIQKKIRKTKQKSA